jgi:hypothetical protein
MTVAEVIIVVFVCLFVCFLVELWFELRVSYLQCRHSTTVIVVICRMDGTLPSRRRERAAALHSSSGHHRLFLKEGDTSEGTSMIHLKFKSNRPS